MDTALVVVIVVLVLIAAAVAAFVVQRRRSSRLRERFGPEYGVAVDRADDRRSAERELHQREKRRSNLDIKPLPRESAERYRAEWDSLQTSFVDAPGTTVELADRLVLRMMRESGYPVDDFDQRADDISVDYPEVAQNYRSAHRVAVAQSKGEADTEQLRQAVTAYRRLFDALLPDDHEPEPTSRRERS
jgi:hypothetical protein